MHSLTFQLGVLGVVFALVTVRRVLVAAAIGVDAGTGAGFGILAASASYIAVPAGHAHGPARRPMPGSYLSDVPRCHLSLQHRGGHPALHAAGAMDRLAMTPPSPRSE